MSFLVTSLGDESLADVLLMPCISFQADLTLTSEDNNVQYCGLVDYGKAEHICLEKVNLKDKVASKVLQFMFASYDGFKFPVCHHPVQGLTMRQLRSMLMENVAHLEKNKFQVRVLRYNIGSFHH